MFQRSASISIFEAGLLRVAFDSRVFDQGHAKFFFISDSQYLTLKITGIGHG
jgi:hypothetical protein